MFSFVLGKGVDSVSFMNEIADADWYIESTLHNWFEVITKFSFSDELGFIASKFSVLQDYTPTATAFSSSFGYKLKVWCSFHWIEKLKEYLVYCITGWPDCRLDSKPKILILLICPCLRLELYLLQNVSLCHFNGNGKCSLIRGRINDSKWNDVYKDAFEQ